MDPFGISRREYDIDPDDHQTRILTLSQDLRIGYDAQIIERVRDLIDHILNLPHSEADRFTLAAVGLAYRTIATIYSEEQEDNHPELFGQLRELSQRIQAPAIRPFSPFYHGLSEQNQLIYFNWAQKEKMSENIIEMAIAGLGRVAIHSCALVDIEPYKENIFGLGLNIDDDEEDFEGLELLGKYPILHELVLDLTHFDRKNLNRLLRLPFWKGISILVFEGVPDNDEFLQLDIIESLNKKGINLEELKLIQSKKLNTDCLLDVLSPQTELKKLSVNGIQLSTDAQNNRFFAFVRSLESLHIKRSLVVDGLLERFLCDMCERNMSDPSISMSIEDINFTSSSLMELEELLINVGGGYFYNFNEYRDMELEPLSFYEAVAEIRDRRVRIYPHVEEERY